MYLQLVNNTLIRLNLSSCDLACQYNKVTTGISVLEGFNIVNILIVYAIIFIFTSLLFMYKKWYKNKHGRAIDDRTMSNVSGEAKQGFTVTVGAVGCSENLISK